MAVNAPLYPINLTNYFTGQQIYSVIFKGLLNNTKQAYGRPSSPFANLVGLVGISTGLRR
jgi:hypothetical protein